MDSSPGLADALRSGDLSSSRARQVADVLKIDPTSEDELVEAAKDKNESNRQPADRCLRAKAKARSAEDAQAAYERIRASRYLRHYTDRDGAFRLEGGPGSWQWLPPEKSPPRSADGTDGGGTDTGTDADRLFQLE